MSLIRIGAAAVATSAIVFSWATGASAIGPGYAFTVANALVEQADGKIVVAGTLEYKGQNSFAVARYDASGTPDPTFGTDGRTTTTITGARFDAPSAMALTADGKIVVVGQTLVGEGILEEELDVVVVRYDSDGTLDETFGTGGIVVTDLDVDEDEWATGVVVQADGKILVSARSRFRPLLLRYTTFGAIDTTFGQGGAVRENVGVNSDSTVTIGLLSDGRIVTSYVADAITSDVMVRRYTSSGAPDPTFDADGVATAPVPDNTETTVLAVQGDDKVVVATDRAQMLRFGVDGTLDSGFGVGGQVAGSLHDPVRVLILPDEKVVLAAGSSDPTVAIQRYHPDGTADTTLGDSGLSIVNLDVPMPAYSYVHGFIRLASGKFLAAGLIDGPGNSASLVRINDDGETVDASFAEDGILHETLCRYVPLTSASCVDPVKVKTKLCRNDEKQTTSISWRWRGEQSQPTSAVSGEVSQYAACLYDMRGGAPRLVSWYYPHSSSWNQTTIGWSYNWSPTGIRSMKVATPDSPGLPTASLRFTRGYQFDYQNSFLLPWVFDETQLFEADPGVAVQIVNSDGLCMRSDFTGEHITQHTRRCFEGR